MWSSTVPGSSPTPSTQAHTPQLCRRRAMNKNLRLLSVFVLLISLVSTTTAQGFELEAGAYDTPLFNRLERKGQIFYDRRDPPPSPRALIEGRQDSSESSSSLSTSVTPSASSTAAAFTTANTTTSLSISSSSRSSATSALSLNPTATDTIPSGTLVPTALPSPFDSSLGNNFTSQACPDFFNSFLSNSTFRSCVPVSLLLQNSKSFFSAARSPVILEETLNAACAVSLPTCQPMMASLASELISTSHCGVDYQNQNPLVAQAHAGLIAYQPVYQATCLRSNETDNYCFADAITNQLNPSDAYPYYTAVGLNLPPASSPTCSQCLRNIMTIFSEYAEDKIQPLAATYISTAQEIDQGCGSKFANTSVPVGTMSSTSGAGRSHHVANFVVAVAAVFVSFSLV